MANEVPPAAHPIVYRDFEMKLHRPTMTPNVDVAEKKTEI